MTEELRKSIEKTAEAIRAFGAREVYLFGSGPTGTMGEGTDIDLAVSGLPSEAFLKAYARAVEAFAGREIDLVDLDVHSPFVRYLKTKGELKRVG